ncbi:MAG: bis(5'-nucleosyl)-tetraphosphatase (symmetrical) YqeK [Oscillospiraceae bacterium]
MTEKKARKMARERLSDKRFHHTECVAAAAEKLAPQFGADRDKAVTAAWLHDLLKEEPKDELLKRVLDSDRIDGNKIRECPQLWHAFACGDYLEDELGVDPEIASAVRWHTTGRDGMTPLEETVFLADYISEDRDFPGVDEIRKIAEESPQKAIVAALRQTIDHLETDGSVIDDHTREALRYLSSKGE